MDQSGIWSNVVLRSLPAKAGRGITSGSAPAGIELAVCHITGRSDRCALQQSATGDCCGTCGTPDPLFSDCAAAGCKPNRGGERKKDISDGHEDAPAVVSYSLNLLIHLNVPTELSFN